MLQVQNINNTKLYVSSASDFSRNVLCVTIMVSLTAFGPLDEGIGKEYGTSNWDRHCDHVFANASYQEATS